MTYSDTHLIGLLHSRSSVHLLGNEEVFLSIFSTVRHTFACNDVVQGRLNAIVVIIKTVVVLDTGLNVVTKPIAEGAVATVVW